ncbi:hypothetical protein PF005_g17261 [Phytophthora fragariae]|uniref:Uncharacterized protein n=2 Tax=Phytophthora TaxID=4783 RepID=A0A6A3XB64_9STRA|nr:hypothetical protein PF003_g30644 [Phytophthora fragariae]KAE9045786.1 hypothetical protein PR002_g2035 [Phytophthora rubi]KAE8931445.1 hypothetical protein PF009_g18495 [Phytophthora fragariae]KAE8995765.1 hypothetical protein PF011_g16190 [Phytophthora fragariae]KAE9050736.1 hypothetical protein PR001_g2108 [Phytophthora rubi]
MSFNSIASLQAAALFLNPLRCRRLSAGVVQRTAGRQAGKPANARAKKVSAGPSTCIL